MYSRIVFDKFVTFITFFMLLSFFCLAQMNKEEQPRSSTPFQIGIYKPVQLFPETWDVIGIRVNLLYGINHDVGILDVGLWNETSGSQTGLQLGIGNDIYGSLCGLQVGLFGNYLDSQNGSSFLQVAGTFNFCKGENSGVQIALFGNQIESRGSLSGVQIGCWNGMRAVGDVCGVQIGFLGNGAENIGGVQCGLGNKTSANLDGVQIGALNKVEGIAQGLQFGLVNVCGQLNGWQIGILNFCRTEGLPFMPLINVHF